MTREQQTEALGILREVAESNPWKWDGGRYTDYLCVFCYNSMGPTEEHVPDNPDCPWVRAQKLVDTLDKEARNA